MGERRGVYRILVGKPEGKRPLGRPRHRWEDNVKMDNFYLCTVHSDIYTVHSPTNALFIKLGKV
jgi:hypothetical protein